MSQPAETLVGTTDPRDVGRFGAVTALSRELEAGSAKSGPAPTRAVAGVLIVAAALVTLAVLCGHDSTAAALAVAHADWRWGMVGVAFEAASLAGYVILLHHVVASASPHLRWRDSYDITLGGAAATRVLPTAGLGGVAVTIWALRAHGIASRELAGRLVAFLLLLYSVYLGALLVSGVAIAIGIATVPRGSDLGVLGAAAAGLAFAAILIVARAPSFASGTLDAAAARTGLVGAASKAAAAGLPSLRAGITRAEGLLRPPRLTLLGAAAYWAFDIGVLFATLRAFGAAPSPGILAFSYFLGTLFNLVPLPGSVSGGLVGALVLLGVGSAAAVAGVLAYRAIAIWLPLLAGLPSLASLRASVARWRLEHCAGKDPCAEAAASLPAEAAA